MATEAKMVRWSNLDGQGKAKQFTERGTERTARAKLRASCIFCNKSITVGTDYIDVNGAKFAHKLCVVSHNSDLSKHSKVITHKMIDELAAKKSAKLSIIKKSKRGRPPKSSEPEVAADSNDKKAATPVKSSKRGRPAKDKIVNTAPIVAKAVTKAKTTAYAGAKRGPKPKTQAPAATPSINLSEVREALPGAIVTLTITGTVEAVQRALDKLQN
jgi:hypothetical protein